MMRRVNVISEPTGDVDLEATARRIGNIASVADLEALGRVLAGLPPAADASLDLIGHSSALAGDQLRLGATLITATDPEVMRFFAGVQDRMWLGGIRAVRLLGCQTATTAAAQDTIIALARTLRMPVFGSIVALSQLNYGDGGLQPKYEVYLRDQDALPTPRA
jgi:hypothetical protein